MLSNLLRSPTNSGRDDHRTDMQLNLNITSSGIRNRPYNEQHSNSKLPRDLVSRHSRHNKLTQVPVNLLYGGSTIQHIGIPVFPCHVIPIFQRITGTPTCKGLGNKQVCSNCSSWRWSHKRCLASIPRDPRQSHVLEMSTFCLGYLALLVEYLFEEKNKWRGNSKE